MVEEYDPSADAWGPIRARMPTPHSAIAWGVHEGRIYIETQGLCVMAGIGLDESLPAVDKLKADLVAALRAAQK